MKKHYITAVLDMLETGIDISNILKGLKKLLEVKGHTRLYAAILRGVLMQISNKNVSLLAVVTVGSISEIENQKHAIENSLKELKSTEQFETTIDEALIGGHTVSYNNMLLDRSYKTTLTNLYRSITK